MLADGPAIHDGELALGKNLLVAEVEACLAVRTNGRTHLIRKFHEDIIQEIEQRSRDLHTSVI